MIKNYFLAALGAITIVVAGCNGTNKSNDTQIVVYEAHLQPLNTSVTKTNTTGEAKFVISGDSMTVTIDVKDAPPNMEHWQHFHGFKDDNIAGIPTQEADVNGDSIIDVVETEPASGITMVPFNADPAAMQVGSDTYPKADADGNYHYTTTISLEKLRSSFAKAFGDSLIDLDRRVLYIHGIPSGTVLPQSVASIADIPAQITLPIAVGKIEKVNE